LGWAGRKGKKQATRLSTPRIGSDASWRHRLQISREVETLNVDPRLNRLGGATVLIGSVVAGVALALTPHGFSSPLRPVASLATLGGAVLIVLGSPVVFRRVWERSFVLGLTAYVGMITTLLLFSVAAGAVEGTILPYMASHGGVPDKLPAALGGLEKVALLAQLVGTICFAVAILRRRPYPWWLGVVILVSIPAGFLPLPIQLDGILIFATFAIMGAMTASGSLDRRAARSPERVLAEA
jgi:hypothetical protein